MTRIMIATLGTALVGLSLAADSGQAPRKPAPTGAPKMATAHSSNALSNESQTQLVKQYCTGCHSDKGKAGQLTLASFDAAHVEDQADVVERMIRKLRAGMMPPPGVRRPDADTIKAFVESLETRLDKAAALNPNPGWRPFQRL